MSLNSPLLKAVPVAVPMTSVQKVPVRAKLTDSSSQQVYDEAMRTHVSSQKLAQKLATAEQFLTQKNQVNLESLRDGLTYDEILGAQVGKDELVLLDGQAIDFTMRSVSTAGAEQVFAGGRMILTSKRIIFMSACRFQQVALSKKGDPKKNQGVYWLSSKSSDNASFAYVKLPWCRTVDLNVSIGNESFSDVGPKQDSCFGFCLCCFPKNWVQNGFTTNTKNTRTLNVGVVNPMYGPQTITVHIAPTTSLKLVNSFMAEFQKASPDM